MQNSILPKKLIIFLLTILAIGITCHLTQARNLVEVSDELDTSWPGVPSGHTIIFRTTEPIPAGGQIIIRPSDGDFYLQPGFDHTDIDLATSSLRQGPYQERTIATSVSAVADSVAAITGSSSLITILLNTSSGIASNTYVRIKLGDVATAGETGDRFLINPPSAGSYRIEFETRNASSSLLDRKDVMVAILEPVTLSTFMPKVRSFGAPSGALTYGTTETIMSLMTNYRAYCRFSDASGTPYQLMTNDFSYTGNFYHSILLTGLVGGTEYTYYIRCLDYDNVADLDDYIINFYVEGEGEGTGPSEEDNEGEGTGAGGDSGVSGPGVGGGTGGGGGGGGIGPGSGDLLPYEPLPGPPIVTFAGWGYPNAEIVLLKDGTEEKKVTADGAGVFKIEITEITKGMYTFGLYARDLEGRTSETYPSTFYVEEGTKTSLTNIFLSPTITLSTQEVALGEKLTASGQTLPGSTIRVEIYSLQNKDAKTMIETIANASGEWSAVLDTSALPAKGQYKVRVQAFHTDAGKSEYSKTVNLGVGEAVQTGGCPNGDLNGDGRVNLTDFSILLFYWQTDNNCADQNQDGIVNLTDFSILMYYWTG
ncbi:hypothetical protein D6821_00060 [Candidatus Parcubacteria bacterium]|nr:MAG: hypothetical protein D6821_00060 [Candidatus Parcubacteria bacterium]